MNNKSSLLPVLIGAGLTLVPLNAAKASLLLYYSFDGNVAGSGSSGTTIANFGSLGAAGTLDTGTDVGGTANFVTSGAPGPSGLALQLTPATDGSQNLGAPHVATGFTAAALSINGNAAYTAMAWVNFANATGDNMIFGQAHAGDSLHDGSRNGMLHSGHWGDDLGPDQGVNINSQPGTWHHVAYTNSGVLGSQSIYFDGVLVAGPAGAGAAGSMDITQLVEIGTSNNGGSFSGQLDEIKIYDTELTLAEIQAASIIPEPTSTALLAFGGLGASMMLRRRRSAS